MPEETTSSLNSRRAAAPLYVPPERAELFLERFANAEIDLSGIQIDRSLSARVAIEKLSPSDRTRIIRFERFCMAYGDLLPTHGAILYQNVLGGRAEGLKEIFGMFNPDSFAVAAQRRLRVAWAASNPLAKESGLMLLAGAYMEQGEQQGGMDGFLMVLLHALKRAHLLKQCGNPSCKEPYFVAQRGSQNYCGPLCAEYGQREAKLRWWRERGDERRKERAASKGKAKQSQRKRGK